MTGRADSLYNISHRIGWGVADGYTAWLNADPRVVVLPMRPRHQWIVGKSPYHKMHRVDQAWAVFVEGRPTFAAARTVCGNPSTHISFHAEPEQTRKICRECTTKALGEFVVYRFFNASGRLLYIGYTSDLAPRLRAHSRPGGSPWWPQVANRRFEFFPSEQAARAAERAAIRAELPVHNDQSIPREVRCG